MAEGIISRGGARLMASDYAAIREANKAEYGNVGRWGRDVLVNRYDSSAHFIFEILQNAEDALKRRNGWNGSREVLVRTDTDEPTDRFTAAIRSRSRT